MYIYKKLKRSHCNVTGMLVNRGHYPKKSSKLFQVDELFYCIYIVYIHTYIYTYIHIYMYIYDISI